MFIDERIFNELEVVEERMFEDWGLNGYSDDHSDLLRELAENELLKANNREEYADGDWMDMVEQGSDDIIRVMRFHGDSLLNSALFDYYGGHDNMLKNIRGAVDRYSEDGYVYYVTGIGYDTISADLLNGSADGKAKNEFIAFVNKDNEDKERIEFYKNLAK